MKAYLWFRVTGYCDVCHCFHHQIWMTAKRNYKDIKQYILSCQDLPSYFLFLITDHVHDRAFSLKVVMAEVLETIAEHNLHGKPKVCVLGWVGVCVCVFIHQVDLLTGQRCS